VEFGFPFPLANRVALAYGFGANRLNRNGSILVVSKSLEMIDDVENHPYFRNFERPKVNPKLVPLYLHYYGHEITPIGPNELSMRSVMLVDPQLENIPEGLKNWGMK